MNDEILKLLSHQQPSSTLKCHLHNICSTENSLFKLGMHTCYIVGAVLFNEKNEVLLIQEAKLSCRGTWYLPAGRVEPNETLIEAVKREVVEEAGIDFEPSGLICIEQNSGRWIRFIFAGSVTGGSLKTTAEADAESLQAGWVKDPLSVQLRAHDILRVIDDARTYYEEKNLNPLQRKFAILPSLKALQTLYIRAFVVCHRNYSHSINILQWRDTTSGLTCLPVSCFKPEFTTKATVDELLHTCLSLESYENWNFYIEGVLFVEHSGESSSHYDGMCLTILVNLRRKNFIATDTLPDLKSDMFLWHKINEGIVFDCFNTYENQQKQYVTLQQLF